MEAVTVHGMQASGNCFKVKFRCWKCLTAGRWPNPTPSYAFDAHRGGFDLQAYPAIRGWLARVEATPGFVHHRF